MQKSKISYKEQIWLKLFSYLNLLTLIFEMMERDVNCKTLTNKIRNCNPCLKWRLIKQLCGIIWYYLSIRKWFHFNFELQMSILVNYRCQILWRLCRWGRHHLTPWRLFHHIKTRLNCFSHLNEELHHDFVSWWRPSKDDVNVHGNVEHKFYYSVL